jgi:hypothetical protein
MSLTLNGYSVEPSAVVVIDAETLLKYWKACPSKYHWFQSHGCAESWRKDHKYPEAEIGFSEGVSNPVPLPDVSFESMSVKEGSLSWLAFTDGVTRTIWLLANGCQWFPLVMPISKARSLYEAADTQGARFYTLKELEHNVLANPVNATFTLLT